MDLWNGHNVPTPVRCDGLCDKRRGLPSASPTFLVYAATKAKGLWMDCGVLGQGLDCVVVGWWCSSRRSRIVRLCKPLDPRTRAPTPPVASGEIARRSPDAERRPRRAGDSSKAGRRRDPPIVKESRMRTLPQFAAELAIAHREAIVGVVLGSLFVRARNPSANKGHRPASGGMARGLRRSALLASPATPQVAGQTDAHGNIRPRKMTLSQHAIC